MTTCLFAITGLLLVFISGTTAMWMNSSGAGVLCEDGGSICMKKDATCIEGECVCNNPDFPGNQGRLICLRVDEGCTAVVNDPVLLTFNEVAVHLFFPCRYGLTYITTILRDDAFNNVGKCNIQVRISSAKDRGKTYLSAVDMAVKLTRRDNPNHQVSIRIAGFANNGSYHYEILAKNGKFRADGPWGDDDPEYDVNGVSITLALDPVTNMICLEIPQGGIRVCFRHYDLSYHRDQLWLPGVSVAVRNDWGTLRFRGRETNVGFIPDAQSNSYRVTDVVPGATKLTGVIYQWAGSGIKQNAPSPNPECKYAMAALKKCDVPTELEEALGYCTWIFEAPRFIRCYDETDAGTEIMELFTQCILMTCGNDLVPCSDVIDMIGNKNCTEVDGYEKLDDFLDSRLCPANLGI